MVVSLFVTPESGILVHDSFPLSAQYELLIGSEIPYYYFVAKVAHIECTRRALWSTEQVVRYDALCSVADGGAVGARDSDGAAGGVGAEHSA